jgi:hypothetical protein
MSIHETSAGDRCPGGTPVEQQPPRQESRPEAQKPSRGTRKNEPHPEDSEMQAAFAVANEKRLRRFVSEANTKPIDRRIYGVNGAQIVRGGAPGHGKRS